MRGLGRAGHEQNRALRVPRPAAGDRRIAQRLTAPPAGFDRLELFVGEESEGSAVRRPERHRGSVRIGKRRRGQRVEGANVEEGLSERICSDEREPTPIGRQGRRLLQHQGGLLGVHHRQRAWEKRRALALGVPARGPGQHPNQDSGGGPDRSDSSAPPFRLPGARPPPIRSRSIRAGARGPVRFANGSPDPWPGRSGPRARALAASWERAR